MAKWIQDIELKKGALHKELGIPEDKKIPINLLEKIKILNIGDKLKLPNGKVIMVTRKLKRRANLALNFKRMNG